MILLAVSLLLIASSDAARFTSKILPEKESSWGGVLGEFLVVILAVGFVQEVTGWRRWWWRLRRVRVLVFQVQQR